MPPLNIAEIARAEKAFVEAYGRVLVQWGIIEQRLCFWFVYLTKMPDQMARAMFYNGVRSFEPRNRLLKIAAENSTVTHATKLFLKTTINKAAKYSATRNKLAHCETKYDLNERSTTYAQMILVEGGQPITDMETTLTLDHLPTIQTNFRELSRLIMDAYQDVHVLDEASFLKLRQHVHSLPTLAYESTPNPNPIKD